MHRTHQIKLNPTKEQIAYFMQACGIARYAYNWAYREYMCSISQGKKINWYDLIGEFRSQIDEKFPFVKNVTKCSAEYAFSDLKQSINRYYTTKKNNPNIKLNFPGLRKRHKKIGSFGLGNDQFKITDYTIHVPRLGNVNMCEKLRYEGKILSGRIIEKSGKWYVSVCMEVSEDYKINLHAEGAVGIDTGLKTFMSLSSGEVFENQKYFKKCEKKLARLQKSWSRKFRNTNIQEGDKVNINKNWNRMKSRVQKFHTHVTNQRKDFIHKTTTTIASQYELICVEHLNLKGFMKMRLSKSFQDVGIGEAVRELEYKAKQVQKVGKFFASTQLCSTIGCGYKKTDLTLSDREWICPKCGAKHERDHNASVNIVYQGAELCNYTGKCVVNDILKCEQLEYVNIAVGTG